MDGTKPIPLPIMFTAQPVLSRNPAKPSECMVVIPGVNALTKEQVHLILHPVMLPMLKKFARYVERKHPSALKAPTRGPGAGPPPEWMRRSLDASGNGKDAGGGPRHP